MVESNRDNIFEAVQNLHSALKQLGLQRIKISTIVSFIATINNPFPASKARVSDSNLDFFRKLLRFLEETDTPLLINLYPYQILKSRPEVLVAFALFKEYPHLIRYDMVNSYKMFELRIS
ncbi:Glycoside hydrolase, family 17 [Corchorus capsularis]|uniref:glucan endo-1,3-beta-D-glucosidase n=1 Tax=Corchorus capsularis TaxID=210143 RepID=A0A1R3HDK8_COCAP|nr:Glycoside hydrolase, family 17 [Corchorus capsularis]